MGIRAVREYNFLRPFRVFGVQGLHFGDLRESHWLFEKAAIYTASASLQKLSDSVRPIEKNIRLCPELSKKLSDISDFYPPMSGSPTQTEGLLL